MLHYTYIYCEFYYSVNYSAIYALIITRYAFIFANKHF